MSGKRKTGSHDTLLTTSCHVFRIDPSVHQSWQPCGSKPLNLIVTRNASDLFWVTARDDSGNTIVQTPVQGSLDFELPSDKFCQWKSDGDPIVYGLGFESEDLLAQFVAVLDRITESLREGDDIQKRDSPRVRQHSGLQSLEEDDEGRHSLSPAASPPTVPASSKQHDQIVSPVPHVQELSSSPMRGSLTPVISEADGTDHEAKAGGSGENGQSQVLPPLSMSSPTQDDLVEYPPARFPETAELASLRHENHTLRKTLKVSTENAKRWEEELESLKNTNARLSSALQDTAKSVEEWKLQIDKWKRECDRCRRDLAKRDVELAEAREARQKAEANAEQLETRLEAAAAEKTDMELIHKREVQSLTERCEDLEGRLDEVERKAESDKHNSAQLNTLKSKMLEWHTLLATKIADLDDLHASFGAILKQ